jgi:hypothetical protein
MGSVLVVICSIQNSFSSIFLFLVLCRLAVLCAPTDNLSGSKWGILLARHTILGQSKDLDRVRIIQHLSLKSGKKPLFLSLIMLFFSSFTLKLL